MDLLQSLIGYSGEDSALFTHSYLFILDEISAISINSRIISVCDANNAYRLILQSYENNNGNRQYVSDVSTLWSQDTTLTSSGCYWWYIPDECSKSRVMDAKNYFLCFEHF